MKQHAVKEDAEIGFQEYCLIIINDSYIDRTYGKAKSNHIFPSLIAEYLNVHTLYQRAYIHNNTQYFIRSIFAQLQFIRGFKSNLSREIKQNSKRSKGKWRFLNLDIHYSLLGVQTL